MSSAIDDRRARYNVAILIVAQAIMGSQMPMIFVIGGLAGNMLASNVCLATLPISVIVFGSMTTSPWLSLVMQKNGRRIGFFIGVLGGAIGAAISAYALYTSSFWLLLLGSYFTGIYMSAQGFYRFAATDVASDDFKPKAISYVLAGGLVSAIIGPQLNIFFQDWSAVPFLASYIVVILLNLFGLVVFSFLDLPDRLSSEEEKLAQPARSRLELLKTPQIAVAIICGMVAYALMNLVMTSTPLAVVGCGYTMSDANTVVSGHVLAMFAPSFFTGHLIVRFGVERIISAGLFILAAAGAVALAGVELANFYLALILLGLGWNFGFIGATTLLARSHAPHERGVIQGLNDGMVFGLVTVASLASGGLMNCSGGSPVEGWNAVNFAMVPFLALAGGALIWLALSRRKEDLA